MPYFYFLGYSPQKVVLRLCRRRDLVPTATICKRNLKAPPKNCVPARRRRGRAPTTILPSASLRLAYLFNILHLLTHLFKLGLQVYDKLRRLDIIRF